MPTIANLRALWILPAVWLLAVTAGGVEVPAAERPNILWITCEDLDPHLGCYGDAFAHTPNLDRLAEQSVRYTQAFAPASVCTPARSTLITGVYASSLGTEHLRGPAPLPRGVRPFTMELREAGYYCTNNVKEDYNFPKPEGTWDESSGTAHWRGDKSGRPFFSVFNLMTTHQSRIRFSQQQVDELKAKHHVSRRHDPAEVPLPPYYPDTPTVRRDVARLYDLVEIMDAQVGELLEQLDEDGLAEQTIVFFYSDHGNGMPRHKRWLFDSGTRVPMIVRCPEKYRDLAPGRNGTTTDRLVSFVDFAPTVLSLAGIDIPASMQGSAFLGKQSAKRREYVFGIRDRVDEVLEFSRTVRDHRWRYVRNFMPHKARMQYSTFSEITPTRKELRRLAAEGQLDGPAADLMSPTKPAEELYNTQTDPHEIRNLANSPEHQRTLARLRGELHRWMLRTRDTGLLPEADMHRRARFGSPYEMARHAEAYPMQRILDAAELIGRGPEHREKLIGLLDDKDTAVRYWAATGLLALGDEADAVKPLTDKLADPAPNVRFVAAEALCKVGHAEKAIPVLIEGLGHTDARVRLAAAIALATSPEHARGAVDKIREAIARHQGKGDYAMFIRWSLEETLRSMKLEP